MNTLYRRSIVIDEHAAGRRVDAYLAARFTSVSRTAFVRHIRAGLVLREGRSLKPSSTLFSGDVLHIYVPGIAPTTPPPPVPEVLYEDERLLAVSKPPGMLCHPAGDRFVWGLIGLMKRARPQHRIDLVHRLDRETSGVLVLTKDREANAFLKQAFFAHRAQKVYAAIVKGVVPWSERDVAAPIGKALSSAVNLRRGVRPDEGLPARTTFTVQKRMAAHSLVACRIHTGRTHQIRVHLEHIGFPILGDKLYGEPDTTFLHHLERGDDDELRSKVCFPRQALHAASLTVPHPDGDSVSIQAPIPADMQAIIDGATPRWPREGAAPPTGGGEDDR